MGKDMHAPVPEVDFAILEWWLDDAALPDLIWARLLPGQDGILIYTADGKLSVFETLDEAIGWLRQDEYETFAQLKSDGEVSEKLTPPLVL